MYRKRKEKARKPQKIKCLIKLTLRLFVLLLDDGLWILNFLTIFIPLWYGTMITTSILGKGQFALQASTNNGHCEHHKN